MYIILPLGLLIDFIISKSLVNKIPQMFFFCKSKQRLFKRNDQLGCSYKNINNTAIVWDLFEFNVNNVLNHLHEYFNYQL